VMQLARNTVEVKEETYCIYPNIKWSFFSYLGTWRCMSGFTFTCLENTALKSMLFLHL
jgi:hypothetical protein